MISEFEIRSRPKVKMSSKSEVPELICGLAGGLGAAAGAIVVYPLEVFHRFRSF